MMKIFAVPQQSPLRFARPPSRLRGCLCVVCIIKIIIDSIIIVCLDVINQSWTALYGKLSSK